MASLPFSYTLKLRIYIETQLNLIIKSNKAKHFFLGMFAHFIFVSQNVLHLLHIILKFPVLVWQVPRSSVGRALYRECGPSQDRNPVPGNLQFCFFFLFITFSWFFFRRFVSSRFFFRRFVFSRIFFSKIRFLSYFKSRLEIIWSVFVYLSFHFNTLEKASFHLLARFPFSYTLEFGSCIGTLLNLNIPKSNKKVFVVKSF